MLGKQRKQILKAIKSLTESKECAWGVYVGSERRSRKEEESEARYARLERAANRLWAKVL